MGQKAYESNRHLTEMMIQEELVVLFHLHFIKEEIKGKEL